MIALVFAAFGLMAIHNQQLAVSDPENTYFNKIERTIRLLLNPTEDELEEHLIGKDISCDHSKDLYKKVAAATVIIFVDKSFGAGVFIGPKLTATANHVVDGKRTLLVLPRTQDDGLAQPGVVFRIESNETHQLSRSFLHDPNL